MLHRITVLPQQQHIEAAPGETLLQALRRADMIVHAPCGGNGTCGKCRVSLDGETVLACRTHINRDMTVTLPDAAPEHILTAGVTGDRSIAAPRTGWQLAFDIGTTTVVGYLLENGKECASASAGNPQAAYGADVVSRIRLGTQGQLDAMTRCIRSCLEDLTHQLCRAAHILPDDVNTVSVVGNPAMQQIFLNMPLDNLAKVPFAPRLVHSKSIPANEIFPLCSNSQLLIIPNIAGFIGADTVACILATRLNLRDEMTLLVDIGTNGEMVLGNRHRMVACSTAAGPALEGAGIHFGMGGRQGAIDHVWLEKGRIAYSTIGSTQAVGICGSGLIDAVAVALRLGLLNKRGKILTEDGLIHLTDTIYLNQDDIRQVQLAKGAIAAGIELLAAHMGISLQEIPALHLAGAFGTYLDPKSACAIGLLPKELEEHIVAQGNAAGSGAKLLAWDADALAHAQKIAADTYPLELSSLPEFPKCFARNMRF